MGIYDEADGADPTDGGGNRAPLPEGYYPELMIEECLSYDSKKKRHQHFFKANLEVLVPANGARVGTGGAFLTQVAGCDTKEYDLKGIGQVKAFLGAAEGMEDKEQIKSAITKHTIVASHVNGGRMYGGIVVAARVTHNVREGKPTICNFTFYPVIDPATGKPKKIPGKGPGTGRPATPASTASSTPGYTPTMPPAGAGAPPPPMTPPPPAPAQAPAPPVAGGPVVGMPGWLWHTDPTWAAQRWAFNAAGEQRQLP